MTIKNTTAINSDISTLFPDNTTGLITPAILRTVVNNIVDSTYNRLDDIVNKSFYIDSVNGSDTNNNGKTQDAPFKTIAKLGTIASDTIIHLAANSFFREKILLPSRCAVRGYGIGKKPIISCCNVAPNASFTLASGTTNVYQLTVTPTYGNNSGYNRMSVFENSEFLTYVTSIANCQATPGSFFTVNPVAGTSQTLYINPTGSTNLITNNRTYEYTARDYGIQGGDFCQAENLFMTTCGGGYGSIFLGANALIRNTICEKGTVHNLLIKSGKYINVVAWDLDPNFTINGSAGCSNFITYSPTEPGLSIVFEDCLAYTRSIYTASAGYYNHTSIETSSNTTYDFVSYKNCVAINSDVGISVNSQKLGIVESCYTENCNIPYRFILGAGSTPSFFLFNSESKNTSEIFAFIEANQSYPLYVKGHKAIARSVFANGIKGVGGDAATTLIVEKSTFVLTDNQAKSTNASAIQAAIDRTYGKVSIRECIFEGFGQYFAIGASVALDLDKNNYQLINHQIGATTYTNFQLYKNAVSPNEVNSFVQKNNFIQSPRNGNYRLLYNSIGLFTGSGIDYYTYNSNSELRSERYIAPTFNAPVIVPITQPTQPTIPAEAKLLFLAEDVSTLSPLEGVGNIGSFKDRIGVGTTITSNDFCSQLVLNGSPNGKRSAINKSIRQATLAADGTNINLAADAMAIIALRFNLGASSTWNTIISQANSFVLAFATLGGGQLGLIGGRGRNISLGLPTTTVQANSNVPIIVSCVLVGTNCQIYLNGTLLNSSTMNNSGLGLVQNKPIVFGADTRNAPTPPIEDGSVGLIYGAAIFQGNGAAYSGYRTSWENYFNQLYGIF